MPSGLSLCGMWAIQTVATNRLQAFCVTFIINFSNKRGGPAEAPVTSLNAYDHVEATLADSLTGVPQCFFLYMLFVHTWFNYIGIM